MARMSLLRPRVPFETLVTLLSLSFEEDFPWISHELEEQLMASYPAPHVRTYIRSPLATLCSLWRYRQRGVRTFLPTEAGRLSGIPSRNSIAKYLGFVKKRPLFPQFSHHGSIEIGGDASWRASGRSTLGEG
jgi:hypothetical protein